MEIGDATAQANAAAPGDGLADAHEKALSSLVDNPADLKQPVMGAGARGGTREVH